MEVIFMRRSVPAGAACWNGLVLGDASAPPPRQLVAAWRQDVRNRNERKADEQLHDRIPTGRRNAGGDEKQDPDSGQSARNRHSSARAYAVIHAWLPFLYRLSQYFDRKREKRD